MFYDFRVIVNGLCINLKCDCIQDAIDCAKEQWENEGNDLEDIESVKVQCLDSKRWVYVEV